MLSKLSEKYDDEAKVWATTLESEMEKPSHPVRILVMSIQNLSFQLSTPVMEFTRSTKSFQSQNTETFGESDPKYDAERSYCSVIQHDHDR